MFEVNIRDISDNYKEKGMSSVALEDKINSFLQRKQIEFPELALSGREESRTKKYAEDLRACGQMLFSR